MSILPKLRRRKQPYFSDYFSEDRTLVEILESYPTDKLNSGFGEFYEELFKPVRYAAKEICEIGIAFGGSLQAWEEYFPQATIFGIDNDRSSVDIVQDSLIYSRYGWGKGARTFVKWLDAGTDELRQAADRYYDIVIDDGSHKGIDIINAFAILWPVVKSGGYYIVEDVASSRPYHGIAFDYFTKHAESAILNSYGNPISKVIFRPNMIVLQKR